VCITECYRSEVDFSEKTPFQSIVPPSAFSLFQIPNLQHGDVLRQGHYFFAYRFLIPQIDKSYVLRGCWGRGGRWGGGRGTLTLNDLRGALATI